MKTCHIEPTALYWASFNRFELRLPGQCVIDCSHQGDCIIDVMAWQSRIEAQIESDNFPNKPTPDKIRKELAECGAWSDEELSDDSENMTRLIWCAACNIAEDDKPSSEEPLKN